MARTFDSRRLRLERDTDRQLTELHRIMAQDVGRQVLLAATESDGGERRVPNRRITRNTLKSAIWDRVLKPFYIGQGQDPFQDASPQSAYARLVFQGIQDATRIQAQRQAALLNRVVRDEFVLQWLTGPRPIGALTEQRGVYDPFHTFVDSNGYRLSDRVWRNAIDVRSRIDRLLDAEIANGTSAVRLAELLEDFLTPGARLIRTRTPYGREGSYAARRLARTEIAAAAGRATVNASIANPFVQGIRWQLSRSHICCDICDDYANGGPNGDGVYTPDRVPQFPAHPHDICTLVPVPMGETADLVEELRRDIALSRPRARALQGAFNPDWLTQALLLGFVDDLIERLREIHIPRNGHFAGRAPVWILEQKHAS